MKVGDLVRPRFCPAGWNPYLIQVRVADIDRYGFVYLEPPAPSSPYMQSLFEVVGDIEMSHKFRNPIGIQPKITHQVLRPRQDYLNLKKDRVYKPVLWQPDSGTVYVREALKNGEEGPVVGPLCVAIFDNLGWLSAYSNYKKGKWVMCAVKNGKITVDLE